MDLDRVASLRETEEMTGFPRREISRAYHAGKIGGFQNGRAIYVVIRDVLEYVRTGGGGEKVRPTATIEDRVARAIERQDRRGRRK